MPITEVTSDDVKRVIESVRDLGTERMLAAHGIKTKRLGKSSIVRLRAIDCQLSKRCLRLMTKGR